MGRKFLAILLIGSWVILSGFDLLEDFDLPLQTAVHNSLENFPPNGGPGVDLVNNLIESGDRTRFFHIGLFGLPVIDSLFDLPSISKKVSKIHKLHRVFLI
jgi:hypothetical protein